MDGEEGRDDDVGDRGPKNRSTGGPARHRQENKARHRGGRQPSPPDRHELALERLAARASTDREALGRLLELIQPSVVRYCRARMGPGVGLLTPDDVAQDVLLAVCGALARYRPGPTGVMAFVYGITKNKVVDAFRAAGRDHSDPTDQLLDAASDTVGPDVEAVLTTEIDDLRKLLATLPAAQREVLVLRVALQMSAEETARMIGSTPGAVRVTQHRAMTKVRGLARGDG